MRLDLADNVRIEFCGLGEQNRLCVRGKLRMQVDGNSDHAEIVVEKILPVGLVWLIAGKGERVADVGEDGVDGVEGVAGSGDIANGRGRGECSVPFVQPPSGEGGLAVFPSRPVAEDSGPKQIAVLEEHDLRSFRQHGVPYLLGVAVEISGVIDVYPAASVAAGRDVVEV